MRLVLNLENCEAEATEPWDTSEPAVALSTIFPASEAFTIALGLEDSEATWQLDVRRLSRHPGGADPILDNVLARSAEIEAEAIETLVSTAHTQNTSGDLAGAFVSYRRAEQLLRAEGGPRLTMVLTCLAQLELGQGRLPESATLLDRALAITPNYVLALRSRIALAKANNEPVLAAALSGRLAMLLDDPLERFELLGSVADGCLMAARDAVAEAGQLVADRLGFVKRLRIINEALGDYQAALAAAVKAAELTEDPKQRARALVDAAKLCSERVGHTARAVALYEAAIEDDPEVSGAFAAVETELLKAGDFPALALAYQRQIQRLSGPEVLGAELDLLHKLAALQVERLHQPVSAVETLERLLQRNPQDLPARIELARVLESLGENSRAARALESAAETEPARADTYRALIRLFTREVDHDRVYSTCSVLVALGEADLDEQLTFEQHRPEALPTVRNALDEDTLSQLVPEGHPEELDHLARLIEPAAHAAGLISLGHPLPAAVNEKARIDPKHTTITAARCIAWAAKLLALPEPEIYVDAKAAMVGIQLLPRQNLGVLLGRAVLAGRALGELIFLAAHRLIYAYPGWRLIGYFSTADELRTLMLGGIACSLPDPSKLVGSNSREAEAAARLLPHLAPDSLASIRQVIDAVLGKNGTLDVLAWSRSVEQIACRAGLLACGDVTVTHNSLAVAGVTLCAQSAAERAHALLPFCVSQRYAGLRTWLGCAVAGANRSLSVAPSAC